MTQCNKCTNDSAAEHSTGCLYEHFLSYMNAKHTALLCKAYFDGRNAPHEEYEAYMQENPVPEVQWREITDDDVLEVMRDISPATHPQLFARAVIAKFKEKQL